MEKKYAYVIVLILCFLSFILGAALFSSEESTETSCTNPQDIKQLRVIDDQGFTYAAEVASVSQELLEAYAAEDLTAFMNGKKRLADITDQVNALTVKRSAVLKRLCL